MHRGYAVSGVLFLVLATSVAPMARDAPDRKGKLASSLSACTRLAASCTHAREGLGPRGEIPVRSELVASGLETPWAIAFVRRDMMLVTERKGRLLLLRSDRAREAGGDRASSTLLAEVPVMAMNEGGLLGIALAPSFPESRAFFLYYTADKGGVPVNRIERWVLAPGFDRASPEKVIVDDIPASPAHDGGRLRLGPDGRMYAGTGDARNRDLPRDEASLAGKILRFGIEGEVPIDNPWPGKLAYVKGVRNVQAFDWFDSAVPGAERPLLAIADHGPSGELGRRGHDEISVASAGADLGWPDAYGCDDEEGVTAPSLTWSAAVPPGGAAFYSGRSIPEWRGSLLVGVLGARHLHRVVFDPGEPRRMLRHEVYFEGDPPFGLGRLREVVMGPDEELYVSTSNCDGRGTCPADGDKIFRVTR